MSQPAAGDRRRLAEILAALEDIAAGALDRRVPISANHDEIDAIAYTINVLVGELHFTVDRLAHAERESHRANEQKTIFLRNVSHELRTPLAAILSYAEVLAGTPLGPKQNHAVDRIRANGAALRQLIDDLLDLTRIEAGKLQLVPETVSPAEVAADVVQSLLPLARSKDLTLMLSMSPELPRQIVIDIRRLRQILMNMVGNAVKFTDRGEVVVSLRTGEQGHKLIVDVTDTGIGMSEADQQNLFSTFAQSKTGRGGSGLGLVLARQLSRQLGGDLELVSSRLGEGSRFRAHFALTCSIDSPPPPDRTRQAPDLAGLSVLFAEDNPDILTSYATLLEFAGCKVDKVTNGLEAVTRAMSHAFNVVLMDMQMPILDGLEATRRLRQNGFASPIIALSAHAMAEDQKQFLEAGCNEHIAKPIDIDHLLVRLAMYRPSQKPRC